MFLCNVGVHLRCFLPSGELWCEIIQHSASLPPCSLHTQAKGATAPAVHEHTYTSSFVIMSSRQQTDAHVHVHALTPSWCTWQTVKRMWDHIAWAIINTHIRWAKELLVIKSKVIWMKWRSVGLELVFVCHLSVLKCDYGCKLIPCCKNISVYKPLLLFFWANGTVHCGPATGNREGKKGIGSKGKLLMTFW